MPHHGNDPLFLMVTGACAIAGAVALVSGNVLGSLVVPGHDWVSDTVSDLAAGRYEIIQDVALYGFAAALIALALAGAHLHPGGWRWNGIIAGETLLALCVVIIAARNEYGDNDNAGIVVHIYIVYALGLLFAGVFALTASVGRTLGRAFAWVSGVCAVLWILAAPVFFFVPTSIDGAWERGLGMIAAVWTIWFGIALIGKGRAATRRG